MGHHFNHKRVYRVYCRLGLNLPRRTKRFRVLNVIDEGTRECLAIEVDTSLPAPRLVRVMEQLKGDRGLPKQIRVDNGPELVLSTFVEWCEEHDIQLVYIQLGKPQQNGFAERFNGSFRMRVPERLLIRISGPGTSPSGAWSVCDVNPYGSTSTTI